MHMCSLTLNPSSFLFVCMFAWLFWNSGWRQMTIRLNVRDQLSWRNKAAYKCRTNDLRDYLSDALLIELTEWTLFTMYTSGRLNYIGYLLKYYNTD